MPLEEAAAPAQSRFQAFWDLFRRNRMAAIGLVIFILFFGVALAGLILTSGENPTFDPARIRLQERLRPPLSRAHVESLEPDEIPPFGIYLFGTDDLGRDVFARMLQGAWVSLTVGFVAVGISVVIGIFLGGIAGYYPRTDALIMRLVDIMLCFPSFFLILTVVALLPASLYNIMIVIGLTSWMGTTRFVRAEFLSLREQDFVSAARALGVGDMRIIFRHIMPNAVAPVLVSATIGIATAILTEAGLSFLGFGVPPPHATWGNILADGKRFIFDAPWLTFIPGTAILVVVLAFNLFGEGLRDVLNPRLRERG
jgi:peptide/nickel transport system permease protein